LKPKVEKVRPLLQTYIQYLIYQRINSSNFKTIVAEIIGLPWPESEIYAYKCLMKLGVKGRYSDLHIAAGILAFLKRDQP